MRSAVDGCAETPREQPEPDANDWPPAAKPHRPQGVTLLDAALVLQGINGNDQDKERRKLAVEMKNGWGKDRAWKRDLPRPIGNDPEDSQALLYDVLKLADHALNREQNAVMRITQKVFIAELRKREREPLA